MTNGLHIHPYYDGGRKIEALSPVLADKPYFLIFGKPYYSKNQEVAEALWNAIPAIRQTADYRAKLFAIGLAGHK